MAIITISRQLAALGDDVSARLSQAMGYRVVNKTDIEEHMKSFGFTTQKIEKYDERKPGLLASFSRDRDDYLHYLKSAIYAEAAGGNCIFVGRGVNAVLKDIEALASVFLGAPFETRTERAMERFNCDEHRARQLLEQSDQDREGFHRYFFDVEWLNPDQYHLSLNSGFLSPDFCVEMIRRLVEQIASPEKEAAGQRRIAELTLAQNAVHHILYNKGIKVHFLEVHAEGKTLTLFGVAKSQAIVEAAASAAREVSGTESVKVEIQIIKDYNLI